MGKLRSIINLLEKISDSNVEVRDASDDTRMARRISRPYLEELKELAQDNALYLTNAYSNFSSASETQLLICEALQHKPNSKLDGFFLDRLHSDELEFVCCAAIALGKTHCEESVPEIVSILTSERSNRMKYHLGFALLLLEDSRGIDVFVDVLRSEREYVEFKNGRIFADEVPEIYCVRISVIFGALFDDFSPQADPFRWIESVAELSGQCIELDSTKIPINLVEYHSPPRDS